MHTALKENLCAADFQKFVDFFVDLIKCKHIGIFIFFMSVKGTKLTVYPADVGVVDVSVYYKGRNPFWMQLFFTRTRHSPKLF